MEPYKMMCRDNSTQITQPPAIQVQCIDPPKPVIIGIYGLPGSGKTFWLGQLKTVLNNEGFAFYDGSDVIAAVTPGGLEGFHNLTNEAKIEYRERAIAKIKQECCSTRKTAIVAGHFMFWAEGDDDGHSICTPADLASYTHIVYLDVPVEKIAGRHEILFAPILPFVESLHLLIHDFHRHTEAYNTHLAKTKMDEILGAHSALETIIVMDADKTLAQEDSGVLFWGKAGVTLAEGEGSDPLKGLFSGPLGYSYTAFRQSTLLYEEAIAEEDFEVYCQHLSSMIHMHRDIVDLLHLVRDTTHVRATVVTCGIRSVWEKVLKREGLSDTVEVIGGGRLSDGLVVTPSLKADLVTHLCAVQGMYVVAFGDSPLDLAMLQAADQGIVITGEDLTRSKSMEKKLAEVIGKDGFRPCQILLPQHAIPRLDTPLLPLARLTDKCFIDSVLAIRKNKIPHVLHATDRPGVRCLMTQMRDASISGPALRDVHRRVGWYLGMEFCTQIIGIESYPIPHVEGHQADGHRLLNEKTTLIVPLMRGGEPMAFGVSDAFPLAVFRHAKIPSDIQDDDLKNMATIILVDSVVNTGKSVLEFIDHIRSLHTTIPIVVVAGVIHSQTVSTSRIARALGRFSGLSFVTLRLSDNQFTGRGTTDTGNRLFNTVHIV
ncbi:uncharacterized protein PGRI_082790 [Penicillium griseofulvum]|uniref:Phosphoribosyltransferase domain-containing protein n=1 Tax=Penicillium patulum TaxID=5078 RepID=A0A135LSQ9_PENPA|nr:uncharacterized protein PGRI_082790 [Penicillium griseofulvum]KXG51995.1 hypothetical protein PGRI_082790 [Penicillium griseofulvum]